MPSSTLGSIVSTPKHGLWLILVLMVGSPAWAAEIAPGAGRVRELSQLVLNDCGSCHGMTLQGGLGPALLPQTLAPKGVDYVVQMIRVGNPPKAMPGWDKLLSPVDITWIAQSLVEGRLLTPSKP